MHQAREYVVRKFEGGMHYIEVDKEWIAQSTGSQEKRVLCKMNDQIEFHCAVLKSKEVGHFINIGPAVCKPLNLKEGSVVQATFLPDHSEYKFEMPEELLAVLSTDEEAEQVFQSLSDGNKRGLMYLVTQVKSVDKRIGRALKIAAGLKTGVTSPRIILK